MSGKIFISYRRSDAADFTVALYNELRQYYEEDVVFKDLNDIQPGQAFAEVLNAALDESAVVLVIIGPKWYSESGKRLFEEGDWVRLEIAHALQRKLRVVPVLVNGAKLPTKDELPEDLHALCERQTHHIDNQRFAYDVAQLCFGIKDLLPIKKRAKPQTSKLFDNAFKAVLLLFMLASISLILYAWLIADDEFKEKVFMSCLGGGGMAGGWAAFTRQRWIELRSDQLEAQ